MNKTLLLVSLVVLISCGNRKGYEVVAEEAPEPAKLQKRNIRFERISFSIYPGWLSREKSKDIEINQDSTVYYRLREHNSITENLGTKLDSQSMSRVYELIDSLDFNSLKSGYYFEEDGAVHSLKFVFDNGEASMMGTMQGKLRSTVYKLLNIIESQKLVKSGNRHFSTAKDVMLPPPPGVSESQWYSDSL